MGNQIPDLCIIVTNNAKEIEENEKKCSENYLGPTSNETFECLETNMKWLEWQNDADPIQLTYLKTI